MQEYFKVNSIHCEGACDLSLDSQNTLYTIGSDDILFKRDLLTKLEQRQDLTADNGSFITLAAHPYTKDLLAIGGNNKEVHLLRDLDQNNCELIFKTAGPIYQLTYSRSGKYLAMATEEPTAILYFSDKKTFVRCRTAHTSSVFCVGFSFDEKYMFSTAADGFLKIYKIEEEVSQMCSFDITTSVNMNPLQKLQTSINPEGKLLAAPGRPHLQLVFLEAGKMYLTASTTIKHLTDICICHWHSNNILITTSIDRETCIWNYKTGQKLLTLPSFLPIRIVSDSDRFYAIDMSGTLYEFIKLSILRSAESEADHQEAAQPIPSIVDRQEVLEEEEEEVEPQAEIEYHSKKSKAQKIITCLPQPPVTKSTSYFSNNRFLLISPFGFIIQRSSEHKTIEFQAFSQENRKKILFTNRQLDNFSVIPGTIAYAGQDKFGLIGQDSWEVSAKTVQCLALGKEWLAVAADEGIKIMDLGGNQLRQISFDKQMVALAAYENLLACIYHDSVPMWGCQSLRMQLFMIENESSKLLSSHPVPLKYGSTLKSFGFSTEGLLYAEDKTGTIRVYNFLKAQWTVVFQEDEGEEVKSRHYLIGIKNYELLMFKLEEDELEPTVQPRQQIIKIPMEIRTINTQQSHKNSTKSYGASLFKQFQLEHERFRYEMWYKYTMSREPTNPLYELSKSILPLQSLQEQTAALQNNFLYLVKNLLGQNEPDKAYITVKTFIRSKKMTEKLVQIFEDMGLRELAIKIETNYDERQREYQWQLTEELRMDQIKKQIQKQISLKPVNPMQRSSANAPISQAVKSSISSQMKSISISAAPPVKLAPEKQEEEYKNPFVKTAGGSMADKVKKEFQSRIDKSGPVGSKNTKKT